MARFDETYDDPNSELDDGLEDVEYYAVRPNKTRIKKEIAELFRLGEELSQLAPAQLAAFELPEHVHQAIVEVSGLPLKGARKRLLKYIAGQLHQLDVQPVLERLARLKNQSAHAVREHHLAERWRERLLKDGPEAVTELLDDWPEADVQRLRQWIRNAQKELETQKPPKSSRLLYRYLKELISETDEASQDDDREADNSDD